MLTGKDRIGRWLLLVLLCTGCGRTTPEIAAKGQTQRTETAVVAEALPTPTDRAAIPALPTPTPISPLSPDGPNGGQPASTGVPTTATSVTIEAGDTLLGIALAHGVPMAAIQLENAMGSSTVVRLGQQLVIPPADAWDGASPYWIVHVVGEGETLSEIARAYDLTLAALREVNSMTDADAITAGEPIVLPVTGPAEARAVVTPSPPPEPTMRPATSMPTPTPGAATLMQTATPDSPVPTAPPAAPPAGIAAWPHKTVRIINEVRAAHDLPPLIYNETLAQAAQGQADDCAARASCSHTGSDGSTIKERILRAGYDPASWAECWAIRPTPQEAVEIWMDEVPPNDPHRRTLLTTWLTEIGIGVAEAQWGYYFIADFGKPLR